MEKRNYDVITKRGGGGPDRILHGLREWIIVHYGIRAEFRVLWHRHGPDGLNWESRITFTGHQGWFREVFNKGCQHMLVMYGVEVSISRLVGHSAEVFGTLGKPHRDSSL